MAARPGKESWQYPRGLHNNVASLITQTTALGVVGAFLSSILDNPRPVVFSRQFYYRMWGDAKGHSRPPPANRASARKTDRSCLSSIQYADPIDFRVAQSLSLGYKRRTLQTKT